MANHAHDYKNDECCKIRLKQSIIDSVSNKKAFEPTGQ